MSFDRPLILPVAILCAVALAWLLRRIEHHQTAHDLAYSDLDFFAAATQPRAWIPAALRAAVVVALFLAVAALSRPHLVLPVPARDGAVMICIDTSGSMQSTDVTPTRAEAAKTAARAFIDEAAPGTKIGIIAFSSAASVIQPLTSDHAQAKASLANLPLPNGATAIGDALATAAAQLPPRGHRAVVLITDGVNNSGTDPQHVATYLGAHHVPVYTIGIGTNNGDIIAGTGEAASIDEDALRAYAAASGGAYARAATAYELRAALAHLGRITSIELRRIPAQNAFLGAGFALLLASMLAGLTLGRYP